MSALVGGLIALVVTTALTPVAIRIARRAGIVDRPGALKVQEVPVAYLGGVAVLAGLLAALLPRIGAGRLLVPLVLATLLGLADDLHDLDARLRLGCEVAIGVVAAVLVPAGAGVLGHVVTAAAVVGLLNAVNLLDGLDGLAGGVGMVAALGFALVGPAPRPLGLALAGALAGFLVFNRPPARIYLGDAGAYLVGTALALLCATSLDAAPGAATWAGLPLLVAVPVTDTAVAIVRRRLAGRPLLAGDRSHLYDQLVDRGASRTGAVVRMVAAQVVLTALGVAAVHRSGPIAWTVLVLTAGILAILVVRLGFLTPDGPSPEGLHP